MTSAQEIGHLRVISSVKLTVLVTPDSVPLLFSPGRCVLAILHQTLYHLGQIYDGCLKATRQNGKKHIIPNMISRGYQD